MMETAPTHRLLGGPLDVWRRRTLLRNLILRNLRVKFKRSVLGFVWTLLNPLFTVLVLMAIFTFVIRLDVPDYWAFLLSGYFVWNFVSQTLSGSTYVLAEHAHLVRSVAFPLEIPVLSGAGSKVVEYAVELTLVLAFLALFHHRGLPPGYLFVPWLIALQLCLVLGLVFPLASLAVFYQDVQHGIPVLLTTVFYLSPVFYPASLVPESLRTVYLANPIAGLLTLYHQSVYEGRVPSVTLLGAVTLVSALLLFVGYAIFHRRKALFAEVI